jgi:hypothetical protein
VRRLLATSLSTFGKVMEIVTGRSQITHQRATMCARPPDGAERQDHLSMSRWAM